MTVAYHLDLDGSHDLGNKILSSDATQGPEGSLGGTIQHNLEALTRLHSDHQELCRQNVKLECITAAICIATWTMLAWGSPFVDGLSSCKIRHAQFDDTDRIPALTQRTCSSVSARKRILLVVLNVSWLTDATQSLPCCQQYLEGRVFLSLAVLLSELALACPISVVQLQDHHAVRFIVHAVAANTPDYLSACELISMVYRATSRHYRNAVRYCLDQDDVAPATAHSNEAPYQYSPSIFYTKVVLRLNRHYQPLRHHIARHGSRYDYMRQHAEIASLSF